MNIWLTTASVAYLLGSIPFGYLLVRAVRKQDIRTTGSGNIGATNVMRSGAKGLGIATLLLDCVKGVVAVLLAYRLALHAHIDHVTAFSLAAAAAVFAVLGHVFPVWLRLRGGKGVATALGVFLVLAPAVIGCALVVFLLIFGLRRYVSLASICAAASIPVAAFFLVRLRTPWTLAAFLGIPLLIIAKHHANIGRLLSGTESRFGSQPKVAA